MEVDLEDGWYPYDEYPGGGLYAAVIDGKITLGVFSFPIVELPDEKERIFSMLESFWNEYETRTYSKNRYIYKPNYLRAYLPLRPAKVADIGGSSDEDFWSDCFEVGE